MCCVLIKALTADGDTLQYALFNNLNLNIYTFSNNLQFSDS